MAPHEMTRAGDRGHERGGWWRWALLAAALSWPGARAAAVDAVEPARFFIERIEVVTERLSPAIVLSESLLAEGCEYSEQELREAAHRIRRLPFVLGADLSLARGSGRGRYELRIEVQETRRWFFRLDGDWSNEDLLLTRFDPTIRDQTVGEESGLVALAGRRFALGSRSLLFASVGSDEGLFALGYQRYDLFRRDILLSATVGADDTGTVDGFFEHPIWRGQLRLGVPIRGNHALRVSLDGSYHDFRGAFGIIDWRTTRMDAEIAWVYNSLDDPVLPRSGQLLEAGAVVSRYDSRSRILGLDGRPLIARFEEDRLGLRAAARKSWPVARRQSLSADARAFVSDTDVVGGTLREVDLGVGYELFLLQSQRPNWRELRWEMKLSGLVQRLPVPGSGTYTVETGRARVGLVFRNSWGLYRFTLDYIDRGDLR